MMRSLALLALALAVHSTSAMSGLHISICFPSDNQHEFNSPQFIEYKNELHNEATRQCKNTPPCPKEDGEDAGRRALADDDDKMQCHMRCDTLDEGEGITNRFTCSDYGMACINTVVCHDPPHLPGLRTP